MSGHWQVGPYYGMEVISALRKDVKLGNVSDAIYWATVLREYSPRWETAHKMIAKQLWISAAPGRRHRLGPLEWKSDRH